MRWLKVLFSNSLLFTLYPHELSSTSHPLPPLALQQFEMLSLQAEIVTSLTDS